MSKPEGRYLGSLFVQETPSGAVDGVNAAFGLSVPPADPASVLVYLNGIFQTQGVNYTISGQALTLAVPPAIGQTLSATYLKRTI